ncbi:hypothetical protein FH609_009110 [Streptomyces sp. 3MP-14]|uniref:Transmembrane protein n=2 Tax=Streptomyces TaxID=1883 RepID=A0A5N6AIG8_9ACTN|nr:hypothetical protein FH607_008310 [Streptomyces mimosae]KAB8177672.1 hypothetical protein FH609_009110 [Streptomyces sp. 3MP-14]
MEASPRETSGTTERTTDSTPPVPPAPPVPRPAEGLAPDHGDPARDAHLTDRPPLAGEPLPHDDDPLDPADEVDDADRTAESYADLRPPRRLRLTLFAPIVVLSLLGSLMFAFPLAFAFDEAGAVVAMLGLLIGSSAAGWGMMAARRVGYTWPGVPPRGSGRRPDWRMLLLYAVALSAALALAVWRVAGLR